MKNFLRNNFLIIHLILFSLWFITLMIGIIHSDIKNLPALIPLIGLVALITQLFLLLFEEYYQE